MRPLAVDALYPRLMSGYDTIEKQVAMFNMFALRNMNATTTRCFFVTFCHRVSHVSGTKSIGFFCYNVRRDTRESLSEGSVIVKRRYSGISSSTPPPGYQPPGSSSLKSAQPFLNVMHNCLHLSFRFRTPHKVATEIQLICSFCQQNPDYRLHHASRGLFYGSSIHVKNVQ